MPTLTIVGEDAKEYPQNEEIHLAQHGCCPPARDWLDAIDERPSAPSLVALVRRPINSPQADAAVVITDTGGNPMLGTMLAARLPDVPIYAYAPDAPETLDAAGIVGCLQTFRLTMDLPTGHSQDVWERAAQTHP